MSSHRSSVRPTPLHSTSNPHLWSRFFKHLRRKWWIPLLTLTFAMGGGAAWYVTRPPQFVSYASMWMPGRMNLVEGGGAREQFSDFLGTQMQLIRSPLVVERAHTRVLESRPGGQRPPLGLLVNQVRNASIITLQATGTDPGYLPVFLEAVMDEYLAFRRSMRQADADDAVATLQTMMTRYERDVATANERLRAFEDINSVVNLEQEVRAVNSKLADLERQQSDLALELQVVDLGLSQSSTTRTLDGDGVIPGIGSDPGVVRELTPVLTQIRLLHAQEERLSETHRPEHPRRRDLARDIARYEMTAQTLRDQSDEQIRARREAIRQRQQTLEEAARDLEPRVIELKQIFARHAGLKDELDRVRNTFETLRDRIERLDLTRNLERETFAKMGRASDAREAQRDFLKSQLPIGFLGLAFGLGIIYLFARFDGRVLGALELADLFSEPVIGQIPRLKGGRKATERLQEDDSRFMLAESFRSLRSSLLYNQDRGEAARSIVVTSSVPGEGKTLIALNLAQTLAWSGADVLLIDADMRRGRLHRHFNLEAAPGLGEALASDQPWEEVVQNTPLKGLYLLSAGKPRCGPGELLLSDRFGRLLDTALQNCRFVIIDSPPVLAADDVTNLVTRVGGVIFVLRASHTAVRVAHQALDRLRNRGANLLGIVVNGADARAHDYYDYKYTEYYTSEKPEKTKRPSAAARRSGFHRVP